MAHDRENNALSHSQSSRINTIVQRHDLSNRSLERLGKIEESVTGLNSASTDALAEGVRADGHEDDLRDIDDINVLDLGVLGDEGVESDVEGGGDGGQGVAGADVVGGSDTGDTGLGGFSGGGDAARVVVGVGAVLWNGEDLTGLDEVDVGDVVGSGDVADARAELLGDGGEGVTRDDGVVDGAGRATDACNSISTGGGRLGRVGRGTSTVGLARQDEAVGDGAQRGRGQDEGLHF